MDAWFWIHLYVVFRGLCAIFWETIEEVAGARPEKLLYIKMQMPTLTSLGKYVSKLRKYDIRSRQSPSLPRLIVEGTYYPPDFRVTPFFTIHGHTTADDMIHVKAIMDQYPNFARTKPKMSWFRMLAIKVHSENRKIIAEAHRLCLSKGIFFVVTVTNDPFVEPFAITIGLDAELEQEVVATMDCISVVSF